MKIKIKITVPVGEHQPEEIIEEEEAIARNLIAMGWAVEVPEEEHEEQTFTRRTTKKEA